MIQAPRGAVWKVLCRAVLNKVPASPVFSGRPKSDENYGCSSCCLCPLLLAPPRQDVGGILRCWIWPNSTQPAGLPAILAGGCMNSENLPLAGLELGDQRDVLCQDERSLDLRHCHSEAVRVAHKSLLTVRSPLRVPSRCGVRSLVHDSVPGRVVLLVAPRCPGVPQLLVSCHCYRSPWFLVTCPRWEWMRCFVSSVT